MDRLPLKDKEGLEWTHDEYKYLSYDQMRERMYNLQKLYPDIMKVETAEEKYGIPHYTYCGNNTCKLDIVTITDFQADENTEKAQVYISGALHGDEVIGINVAYYLIEYLVTNYQTDSEITALIKNREIIITPMTNAVGYYHGEREERLNRTHSEYLNNPHRTSSKRSFDINRDFPYNTQRDQCLNTIAGRVVHQLFTENVIVSTITFHGGTNVIGYPWGSFNRVNIQSRNNVNPQSGSQYISRETPDQQAFESVGWIMKNQTGGAIRSKQNLPRIQEYIFGDISSTIYPVNGGLEDWAYAAGWDNENNEATVHQCQPQTYLLKGIDQSLNAYKNVRSAIYIVETDLKKKADERLLGARLVSRQSNGKFRVQRQSIDEMDGDYDGHINRNIRLALSIIDLSKPYIHVKSYVEKDNGKVEITWQVNGCHTLNEATAIINGQKFTLTKPGQTYTCNYLLGRAAQQSTFTTEIFKNDNVVLEAVADQHFGKSLNDSNVSPPHHVDNPQTHLAKLRILDNYEAKSKRAQLKGGKYIRLTKDQFQRQLALKETEEGSKPYDGRDSLTVVLTPIIDQSKLEFTHVFIEITGIMQIVDKGDNRAVINGHISNLPLLEEIEVKIMEYGDLSSLAVEYPDYNSLGSSIYPVLTYKSTKTSPEAYKFQMDMKFNNTYANLLDLAGRAVIVTVRNDLLAYGILINETQSKNPQSNQRQGQGNLVALCENLHSTIQYRAIYTLEQVNDKVSFKGLLRTSSQMEDEDELIVSLNYKQSFDLDFDTAYPKDKEETIYQWMHPCYLIEEESIDNQDWILGRTLQMYGQHEMYNSQILESTKCSIGRQNHEFRVSDERFCATSLDAYQNPGGERKYTQQAVLNFFLIGFLCGCILGFCIYLSQKLTFKSDDEDLHSERMETAAKMQFVELTNVSHGESFRKNEVKFDHDHDTEEF